MEKGKYYVTVAGGERLHQELEELQSKRGQVAGNIRTAKSYGDLSENFEYHEAKREQGFMEGRIMQLKQILPQLKVVRPEDVPADRIDFGAVVTVREDTGDEWDYFIVGPLEADPMLTVYPALCLAVTIMAFNFLGDGLRDWLDPRSRTV